MIYNIHYTFINWPEKEWIWVTDYSVWLNPWKVTPLIDAPRLCADRCLLGRNWKECLKHCWIFRLPGLSFMWQGWSEVQPLFSLVSLSSSVLPLSPMMSVSRTWRIRVFFFLFFFLALASHRCHSKKFWWKLQKKASERRGDQIGGSISPGDAEYPWEGLWDHNTSP